MDGAVSSNALTRKQSLHALMMTGIIVVVVTHHEYCFWRHASLISGKSDMDWQTDQAAAQQHCGSAFCRISGNWRLMIVLMLGPNSVIGAFFEDIGFKVVYALPGMILATLFVTFPLMVREVMPVLQEIGAQQEEAASTLGAYPWYTFWQVTWPSIRWGVIYGVVLTVARSLGEFGAVLVVSGNIMNKTQTATTLVYQDVENFNVTAASSVALVLAAFSVGLLLLMEWAKKRKEVH